MVVFESEPGPGAAGRRLAAELIGIGVQATIASGLATGASLHGVHAALIGADAVTPGFVVNGTPSLVLAEAVKGRAPLYVVAETLKFARRVPLSPGYDRIPLDLVTAVVSEVGVQGPDELARWSDEAARGTA